MAVQQDVDQLRGKIDRTLLPVLPPGLPYLLKSLADENLGFRDLADAMQRFPSIAARLIALANSAWSAPVQPIANLDAACGRLGLNVVRSVSIALAVAAPFNSNRCPLFDAERYWCSALLTAEMAASLAQSQLTEVGVSPQTARSAGLLHNLGLLWLADNMPLETGKAFESLAADSMPSVDHVLRTHCGVGYSDVGGYLADAWRFPSPIAASMANKDPSSEYAADGQTVLLVRAAAHIVSLLMADLSDECPSSHADKLNMTRQDWSQTMDEAVSKYAAMREIAKALFSDSST